MRMPLGWIVIVLVTTLPACSLVEHRGDAAPGLVDVGGRQLYLTCQGEGSPTVVLEAGGMGNSVSWRHVLPKIAEVTRVCAYDRAGEGHSSSVPAHGSFDAMVRDLHALLNAGGIEGPYVLVGHSFGGRVVPHFAALYPKDVGGMVLVDPGHEAFSARAQANLAPEEWQQYLDAGGARMARFEEAQGSVDLEPPANFLLIVLSASRYIDRPGVPDEVDEKLRQLLVTLHKELVEQSSDGIHVMADDSGHGIQDDRPDLVIGAIRQAVEAARAR